MKGVKTLGGTTKTLSLSYVNGVVLFSGKKWGVENRGFLKTMLETPSGKEAHHILP